MCLALGRAVGASPAWALELLRAHPRTFDSFWAGAFATPPEQGSAGDIDAILGRN